MTRRLRPGLGASLAMIWLLALGCATSMSRAPLHPLGPAGRWYVVQPGDTAASIARAAGVPVEDLLEINGLASVAEVRPGKTLFVLAPSTVAPTPDRPSPSPASPASFPEESPPPAPNARLRWPVVAPRITSPFGARWGRSHDGIDIGVPTGTPVFAAADGKVIYAGDTIRGYGNMVVVQHPGDLLTVYAHNSVLLVHPGDAVLAGQQLALSGQSGRATAPHLHFEVRAGQIPRDPMGYLPPVGRR